MHCPYCGGLNQDRAVFCVNCGRDLKRAQPNAQPQRPPAQTPQQGYPTSQPAYQRPGGTPAQAPRPGSPTSAPAQTSRPPANRRAPAETSKVAPTPEPEPPAPFPPRTIAQFETLLTTGCQAYTVAESHIENGQRKVLTITYPRCANWQQAATLLKALRDNQEERYITTIVRGVLPQQQDTYSFTNGQLQFDRAARLGAQVGKRYMLETGNGYTADSLRFVLNE